MPITAHLSSAYGNHPPQRVDVFVPAGGEDRPLVACFAGGWWQTGRHEELRALCLALADAGHPAAAIGTRVLAAPGNQPMMDQARHGGEILADARAGLGRALEDASISGHDGRSCILLGSGSGSLVALTLAHRLGEAGGRKGEPVARAAIACGTTPGLDHGDAAVAGAVLDRFAGTQHSQLSPLHLDPHHFPPLLLLHGLSDQEVTNRTAQRLQDRVAGAGEASELELLNGLGHQFVERPWERSCRSAMDRILAFLARHAPEAAAPAR